MAEGPGVTPTGAAAVAAEALSGRLGQQVHLSDWLLVSQHRVDAFAGATGDHQWIHVDPERAARESPYKAPIAHGYLTLSLHILLRDLAAADKPYAPGVVSVINYGLNKVRFPNAVRVGARIRGRFTLTGVEVVASNVLQVAEQYLVEIEGQTKPACIAESLFRLVF